MNRIILFLLCVATVITFCSCSSGTENTTDEDIAMEINGVKISTGLYRYFYMSIEEQTENNDESIIKKNTEETLKAFCAVYSIAEKIGVSLDITDYAAYDTVIADYKAMYTEQGLLDIINEMHFESLDVYKTYSLNKILIDKITEHYEQTDEWKADNDNLKKYFYDNFIHFGVIIIDNDEGESVSENLVLANEIAQKAADGDDFEMLLLTNTEDISYRDKTVAIGTLSDKIEQSVLSLSVDQTSEAIEYDNSFLIIKRYGLSSEYFDENSVNIKESFISGKYTELIENEIKDYTVKYY